MAEEEVTMLTIDDEESIGNWVTKEMECGNSDIESMSIGPRKN